MNVLAYTPTLPYTTNPLNILINYKQRAAHCDYNVQVTE